MAKAERMIRAFVAVDIPEEIKEKAALLLQALAFGRHRRVKWVSTSGLHITLKFLGDIREPLVPDLEAAMREVADHHGSFSLFLKGCGAFPSLHRPRVIWAGVDGDVGVLGEIKRDLDSRLEPLGFAVEDREFKPHVTLGRVRKPAADPDLAKAVASQLAFKTDFFCVKEMVLYQSILKSEGAEYRPLAKVKLGKP